MNLHTTKATSINSILTGLYQNNQNGSHFSGDEIQGIRIERYVNEQDPGNNGQSIFKAMKIITKNVHWTLDKNFYQLSRYYCSK